MFPFLIGSPTHRPRPLTCYSLHPPDPQQRSSVDYGFIEAFCRDVVARQYTPQEKRAVLAKYVEVFKAGRLPQEQLERILQV